MVRLIGDLAKKGQLRTAAKVKANSAVPWQVTYVRLWAGMG